MASSEKGEEVAQVEAPEAPQGYQYVNIDPVVQRRVVRKLDWNLIPLVMALCKLHSLSASFMNSAYT
jgi:hypothetical protein